MRILLRICSLFAWVLTPRNSHAVVFVLESSRFTLPLTDYAVRRCCVVHGELGLDWLVGWWLTW